LPGAQAKAAIKVAGSKHDMISSMGSTIEEISSCGRGSGRRGKEHRRCRAPVIKAVEGAAAEETGSSHRDK
jgi:hypothetical protein